MLWKKYVMKANICKQWNKEITIIVSSLLYYIYILKGSTSTGSGSSRKRTLSRSLSMEEENKGTSFNRKL
jgi:hypothetical protein